jgi:hypothetical protein
MRLRTAVAPLVAINFSSTRPYFFVKNVEGTDTETRNSVSFAFKNKGADEKTLRLLRAQLLIFWRVLIIAILFDALFIIYTKMEKQNVTQFSHEKFLLLFFVICDSDN